MGPGLDAVGTAIMLGLPGVAAVVGAVLLRNGTRARRRMRAMNKVRQSNLRDEVRQSNLRDVSPADDFVIVTGQARATEEGTTAADILGAEALLVDTEVKHRATKTSGSGVQRVTDHDGTDSVPFVLDDGTGPSQRCCSRRGQLTIHASPRSVSRTSAGGRRRSDGSVAWQRPGIASPPSTTPHTSVPHHVRDRRNLLFQPYQ